MSTTAYAGNSSAHTVATGEALAPVTRVGLVLIVTGLAFVSVALAAPTVLTELYGLLASSGTVSTMNAGARFGAVLFGNVLLNVALLAVVLATLRMGKV